MCNEVNYAKQIREKILIRSLDFNTTHEFNNRKPQKCPFTPIRFSCVLYRLVVGNRHVIIH